MRKLTTDDFALSAAIATIFLLGVAIGTGIGNWDNFREWIGALSGWAAVLVAGVTAYFIFIQLKELSIQTRTLSGDLDPTFTAQSAGEEDFIVFGLRNLNRKRIIGGEIKVLKPEIVYLDLAHADWVADIEYDGNKVPACAVRFNSNIDGWMDQSNGPKLHTVAISFWNVDRNNVYRGELTFEVRFRFEGDDAPTHPQKIEVDTRSWLQDEV
ncbi:MAG: hypothetical protein CML67_14915 [Rhodobacteraceae bacterium]|nr:hypothetical protein [Paracoccaceae bacterium]